MKSRIEGEQVVSQLGARKPRVRHYPFIGCIQARAGNCTHFGQRDGKIHSTAKLSAPATIRGAWRRDLSLDRSMTTSLWQGT